MKSIAIIIAGILLLAPCASAQMNIGSTSDGAKKLATVAQEWNWIYLIEGHYALVTKTTNQFDDWIWLDLGTTREEAIKTTTTLIDVLQRGEKGQETPVESFGREYTLIHGKTLGVLLYNVHAPGHAGLGNITITALKKTLAYLSKE